jgi:AcrR family transcriptional regulator
MSNLTTTEGAARGRRLRRDERRDQLLDSAATLLVDRGPAAVTMEGVAAAAGVSKALPYAHFDNATELLRGLRDRELDRLREHIISSAEGLEGLEALVASGVHAYFDVINERGAVLVASLRGLPLDDEESARRRNPGFYVDMFGTFLGLPPEIAQLVSAVFVTGIDGAVEQWVKGEVSRATAERVLVRLTIGGATAVADARKAGLLDERPVTGRDAGGRSSGQRGR